MRRTIPLLMAVGFYMVAVMGAVQGAHVAYTADSPDEAVVSYNGTHYTVGDTSSKVNTSANASEPRGPYQEAAENITGPTGELLSFDTPADPYVRAGVERFADQMVHWAFTLAAFTGQLSASLFYRLQFIPLWLVSGVFHVAAWLPVLGLAVVGLSRLSEVLNR